MKKRYALIFALFFVTLNFAQQTPIHSVLNVFQKEKLIFEKVFIHTNKTKYQANDVIWFKAYIVTDDNKPSIKTTTLYVSLFSESGQLINTQNIFIQGGVGHGQFELFGDLKGRDYYIQANTNYMRNFGEENKYLQKIEIVNDVIENTVSNANYDIQVFPQGGYLLENVKNILGLKALLNGKSVEYTGRILNSRNKEVARFKNEHLGMSKVAFHYFPSEEYTAEFKANDTVISIKIPKAKSTGIVLNTTKSTETVLNLELKTNVNSIKSIKNQYTLLFHRNNTLVDYVGLNLIDTSTVKYSIPKAGFVSGVNTITIFKDSIPVLERKFFVYKKEEKQEVTLSKLTTQKDSIIFKLKAKGAKVSSNISLSVLPKDSNYKQFATIESAFLLTPYLKGYVEHPAYYFKEGIKNRLKHLDLLLLTQGWVAYDTKTLAKRINPERKYNFEQGFSLKGSVSPLKSNVLALLSKDKQIIKEVVLKGKHDFKFNNLLVYRGDSIRLSFLKGTGSSFLEKPRKMTFDTTAINKQQLMYSFQKQYSNFKKVFTNEQQVGSLNLEGVNTLKEVEVKGKRRIKKGVIDKAFIDQYRKQIFDLGAYNELDISKRYVENNLTLRKYLSETKGLRDYVFEGVLFLSDGRITVKGGKVYKIGTIISIDGTSINKQGMSLAKILNIKMEDIKTVAHRPQTRQNPTALKEFPHLAIFTTDNYKKGIKELFKHYVFKNGYDTSKRYYSPLNGYTFENNNTELDWKPNLVTNASGEVTFKIKKTDTPNEHLFIVQGFTEQGRLISSIVTTKEIAY